MESSGSVMLHHSFEHLADPRRALERVRDLVDPGRYAIVRVPVVSWAWREYGVDWFQLDAPRHLFLFTERGFRDLAEASGFAVDHVAYDSTEFQFWVSEQYRSDIPLFDERSYFVNPEGGLFTRDQIVSWKRLADRLNAEGEGDQACYYLRRQ